MGLGALVAESWREVERAERECEHGLSYWLCADPVFHYPPDYGA